VERRVRPDGQVSLKLMSLPHDPTNPEETGEAHIVAAFLSAVGQCRPQLVGFGSVNADLRILVQRGVILGLEAAAFSRRPQKPWEGVDYLGRGGDWNIDLKELLGGWGKGAPSLHEVAVQCGIPGKLDVDGRQVAQLWLSGELPRIVRYNQFDALTTYLLWLRVAHFAGQFSAAEYASEQDRVRDLVEQLAAEPGREQLRDYLVEWERLERIVADARR
jgi:3'-5' exonuclease